MKIHLMYKLLQIIMILFLVFLTGCAVGRRTINLPIQTNPAGTENKGEIFIGKIEDGRIFQNNPSDPSTPSIDGDVHTLTEQQKGRMIGRQRATFGNALGDVALPANDSVVTRTRRLLQEGFKKRGYSIASNSNSPNMATATINQFWGWFTPGFWTITFEARINCNITLTNSDGPKSLPVQGWGRVQGQVGRDENWQLAFKRAFQDFLSKLDTQLAGAGY